MTRPKVLVVDDNRTSRLVVTKALRQFDCDWTEASGGQEALERLAGETFDLVLLDIDMPDIDGLEVLRRMRGEKKRLETPVLVISGHDDDIHIVASAVQLGADDFLPKPFDMTLFRARVASCFEKKRLRDVELDHLRQIDRLSAAAARMEAGRFHPGNLQLDDVVARGDAIGRLASVFMEMARQVYDREYALQRNVRTLRGGGLLMLQGLLWGLVVPLSVLIYQQNPLTLGVAFWTNLIAGVVCCGMAVVMGKNLRPDRSAFGFLLAWALLFGLSSFVLFEVAGRVTGIVLSIIMALQGLAVFTIAAAARIESPSLRRLAGLGVGLAGVLALLFVREPVSGQNDWIWIVAAMLVPVLYGVIDILLAVRHPLDLDAVVSSGIVLVLSAVIFLPLAAFQGHLFLPGASRELADILVVIVGLCVGASTVLYVWLIALAGPVFGSQSAYAITLAGILWSVLLLGEVLTVWTIVALALVVLGLALVGPKREAGNVEVEFRRRRG
jgi:DNA-binding response OmpR family regulator/drug/metabolite transporter (DMT)-like permease